MFATACCASYARGVRLEVEGALGPGQDYVRVGQRYALPVPFVIRLTPDEGADELDEVELPGADGLKEVELSVGKVGDGLGITKLTATAAEGQQVTSKQMRGLPLGKLVARAVRWSLNKFEERPGGYAMSFGHTIYDLDDEELAAIRAAGPTDENLQRVADLSAVALLVGDSPSAEVEAALGLTQATAYRWIRKAREKGFLVV